ncbi:Dual adapter for phosphotyrosine and 3-phosphotyrosine and 3-phosphoinositide [Mactra antiquata]
MCDDPVEVRKLKELEYFHPDLDRHKTEAILLQNGHDGTFLVRNSSNSREFAVSVRAADAVKHFNLSWRDDGFQFGHGTYETCNDLAYHFCNKPMLGVESGQTTLLTDAYPRSVIEPKIYDSVRVHAEYNTSETIPRTDFSINSKDGYLTKLGDIFKTWRTRWFVLQNNELKYFKDSSHKTPVRTLDLNECRSCKYEGSYRGKRFVFSLQFDWRTFYVFGANEKESQEWIKLITWRLDKNNK